MVLRSNLPQVRGTTAIREFFFFRTETGLGEVEVDPPRGSGWRHGIRSWAVQCFGALSHGKRREERGKFLWVLRARVMVSGSWLLIAGPRSDARCQESDATRHQHLVRD